MGRFWHLRGKWNNAFTCLCGFSFSQRCLPSEKPVRTIIHLVYWPTLGRLPFGSLLYPERVEITSAWPSILAVSVKIQLGHSNPRGRGVWKLSYPQHHCHEHSEARAGRSRKGILTMPIIVTGYSRSKINYASHATRSTNYAWTRTLQYWKNAKLSMKIFAPKNRPRELRLARFHFVNRRSGTLRGSAASLNVTLLFTNGISGNGRLSGRVLVWCLLGRHIVRNAQLFFSVRGFAPPKKPPFTVQKDDPLASFGAQKLAGYLALEPWL